MGFNPAFYCLYTWCQRIEIRTFLKLIANDYVGDKLCFIVVSVEKYLPDNLEVVTLQILVTVLYNLNLDESNRYG